MDIIGPIIFQIAMISLNAIFACAEIAVLSVNDAKIAQLKEKGDKRAARLEKITENSSKFLAVIQVAITLAGFLGSAFAANNFAVYFIPLFEKIGIPASVGSSLAVIVITILLSYITLVFGELVPKRIAMKKAEKMALSLSGLLRFVAIITAPIVWLLTASTNGILRLMGIDPNETEEAASEDEIKLMVDESARMGIIDDDENEIIHNLFEFDDLPVSEFATHRTDVAFLWEEDGMDVWEKTIIENRFSYYPVCGETVDEIKGVLCAKDYFAIKDRHNKALVMKKAVRPAHFVPESIKADVLFKQMKKIRNHFGVVLDEYGGVAGIVTMTDLLSQIMGDFDDDPDEEDIRPDIEKVSEDTWLIKGSVMLDEIAEELGIELPEDEYDTLGGYAFGLYGAIPEDGTTFTLETEQLIIVGEQVDNHRLELARVTKKPDEEKDKDEEE